MHPSRAIRGRRSQLLAGRRVIIAISGSIAAIEAPRIIRELIRHGADVRAVMSPDATRIVTAEAIRFATGTPPVTELSGDVEHVSWLGPGENRADLLLIAPATANTIGKIAHGIDDTAVTSFASVALGGQVPVLLAPAMHGHMAQNPAVRENLARLAGWGVGVIAPQVAEGEEKIASPEEVAAAVLHRLARGPWVGRQVLVIGGASREPIDDVRSLTNESSGETAVSLATQAHYRGATVESWLGGIQVPVPGFLMVRRWRTLDDLLRLVDGLAEAVPRPDAVWVPAALADFTLTPSPGKIHSRASEGLRLDLRRAPKVLARLRERTPPPTQLVGFKLESGASEGDLVAAAESLRTESGLDWVVANDRAAMGSPESSVILLTPDGRRVRWAGLKAEVAGKLLDEVGGRLADLPFPGAPAPGSTLPPSDPGRPRGRRKPSKRRAE